MATSTAPRHALSVDVEDWYHDGGSKPAGGALADRVVGNTERLLDLFAASGARGTFFFLGDVAERYPRLARQVADAGHEIASHGDKHGHLSALSHRAFRDDVARSIAILQDAVGVRVRGYRAPYFSIKAGEQWPIEILGELGIDYDSSVLAIDRPPGLKLVCPRTPYRHRNGILEVPVAVLQLLRLWHLPVASGGGLRLVPPRLLRRALEQFERDVGAGVFYLHPWELDPKSPTCPGPGRWWLRVGRHHLEARLKALLNERRFVPIREAFAHLLPPPP